MSERLRDQLPHGSNRNKVEALADYVEKLKVFHPVSMVLSPQKMTPPQYGDKNPFLMVYDARNNSGDTNGYFEVDDDNAVNFYQFTKPFSYGAGEEAYWDDIGVYFQYQSSIRLYLSDLPEAFQDVEKLKGLGLNFYLNPKTAETRDSYAKFIGGMALTVTKRPDGTLMLTGESHGTFKLPRPVPDADDNDYYLTCSLDWYYTGFEYSAYTADIVQKPNAFDLNPVGRQAAPTGLRFSILDVCVPEQIAKLPEARPD